MTEYRLVKDVTPRDFDCAIGACYRIYEGSKGSQQVYLIIGKQIDPKDARLSDGRDISSQVGQGEVLIEVPRNLIDKSN